MDYFSRSNPPNPSRPTSSQTPFTPSAGYPATPGGAPLRKIPTATEGNDYGTESNPRPKPAVRLRRLPSTPLLQPNGTPRAAAQTQSRNTEQTGRRRSFSDPQRTAVRSDRSAGDVRRQQHQQNAAGPLPALTEETSQPVSPQPATGLQVPQDGRDRGASDAASTAAEWVLNRPRRSSSTASKAFRPNPSRNYERDVVDVLDVIGMWMKHRWRRTPFLICSRSRGFCTDNAQQYTEQLVHPELGSLSQPPADVRPLQTSYAVDAAADCGRIG